MRIDSPLFALCFALSLTLGCFSDPIQDTTTDAAGDGDGDSDTGAPSTETGSGSGDGDGDASGDGDGDAAGDGDGDACAGEIDECGVCNGAGGPCLGCTVPQASNYDELADLDDGSCYCLPMSNPVADQSQLEGTNSVGSLVEWQSFTPGIGGGLARLDIELYSPLEIDDSEGTLTIYEGEGQGGTELAVEAILIEAAGVAPILQEFQLSDPVPLEAGKVYTFELEVPMQTAGWVPINVTNPYPGGLHSGNADEDLVFRTHMVSCTPE